jgi:CheY-like chemotaxis protein
MSENLRETLLVEDNRDDVFFMERAVKKSGVPWKLQVMRDGREALDYFSGRGRFADRDQFPLPSLVFLDLKLPYVNGFEILTWLRDHPGLKETPVVILTSSPEERDQQKALELGARAYMVKPPTEDILRAIARGDWSLLAPPAQLPAPCVVRTNL